MELSEENRDNPRKITDGKTRRDQMLRFLSESSRPLSGTELAARFNVSRQVVVQDIALLRAGNKNIMSTNRGYLLYDPKESAHLSRRAFSVCHTDEEIGDELNTIVDFGGKVLDVEIVHEVYGQISVDLLLRDRRDVEEFLNKLRHTRATPLKRLTAGRHIHTVEANSEELLDIIENKLKEKGFLQKF